MLVRIRHPEKLIYPETDGKPMGENTIQVRWIITLYNGLEAVFRDRPDVFIAADLFWYPVKGDPTTVTAPDVMVVVGRPKGDRPSYKQWEEGKVPPQVVFEIESPGNTAKEKAEKKAFYREFGVEEFYEYDPEFGDLQVWLRSGKQFKAVKDVDGFVSPRLGIRFELPAGGPLRVIRPDGRPFQTYQELITEAELQQRRADKLAAKLRELGVDPDRL